MNKARHAMIIVTPLAILVGAVAWMLSRAFAALDIESPGSWLGWWWLHPHSVATKAPWVAVGLILLHVLETRRRETPIQPDIRALGLWPVGLLVLLYHLRMRDPAWILAGGMVCLGAAVWLVMGRAWLRRLALPWGVLLLSIPTLFTLLLYPYRIASAWSVQHVLGWLGITSYLSGDHLRIPGSFSAIIGDVCSGVVALETFLLAGVYLCFSTPLSGARRTFYLALMFPLSLVANILRILLIYLGGHFISAEAGMVIHDHIAGWIVVSFGLLALWGLLLILRPSSARSAPDAPSISTAPYPPRRAFIAAAAIAILSLGFPFGVTPYAKDLADMKLPPLPFDVGKAKGSIMVYCLKEGCGKVMPLSFTGKNLQCPVCTSHTDTLSPFHRGIADRYALFEERIYQHPAAILIVRRFIPSPHDRLTLFQSHLHSWIGISPEHHKSSGISLHPKQGSPQRVSLLAGKNYVLNRATESLLFWIYRDLIHTSSAGMLKARWADRFLYGQDQTPILFHIEIADTVGPHTGQQVIYKALSLLLGQYQVTGGYASTAAN